MLNEVRARHIKKLVVEQIGKGRTVGELVGFEIARREDTISGLESQRAREKDEIVFLKSLDAEDLQREVEEMRDV